MFIIDRGPDLISAQDVGCAWAGLGGAGVTGTCLVEQEEGEYQHAEHMHGLG